MTIGLTSVTFRDKSVQELIALAKAAGLTDIEWGADVHVPAGDTARAKEVKDLCEAAQLKTPSYGSYYKGTAVDDFKPVLASALILEVSLIRIWAGRISPETISDEEFETLVQNIQDVCDLCSDNHIDLALEYHRRSMTQTKEGALRLIKAVNRSNLKTYWQPNPEVPFETHLEEIEALAPTLTTMHVFNWDKDNTRYLLRENDVLDRWRAYAAMARKAGAQPNFLIEFVKDDAQENFDADVITLKEFARKPIAVLMGKTAEIERVYAPSVIQQIKTCYELEEEIITLDNWDEKIPVLQKALVIFSTWGMFKIDEEAIRDSLPNLKALFYAAGSVHSFATSFLHSGIALYSASEANAIPVAETVSSLILLSNKGFFQHTQAHTREDFETARAESNDFPGNKNVLVGLLGAGSVGRKVLAKLKDTDITCVVYDPYVDEDSLKQRGARKESLDYIFENCQTISNHMPDLPSTKGILNASLFQKMLPNAVFINTGRGATVNEADLLEALNDKPDMIAILDVTSPEPPVKDSPLYTQSNVILSPHLAGSSGQEVVRLAETMANEAENFLLKRPTLTKIDPKSLVIKA